MHGSCQDIEAKVSYYHCSESRLQILMSERPMSMLSTPSSPQQRPPARWRSASSLALITYVSFIIAVVGIVLSFFFFSTGQSKPELTLQAISNDNLTIQPDITGLQGNYTYFREPVAHLWKVKISIVNTGNQTLVGEGSQSDVLGDKIDFQFPEGVEILRASNKT